MPIPLRTDFDAADEFRRVTLDETDQILSAVAAPNNAAERALRGIALGRNTKSPRS